MNQGHHVVCVMDCFAVCVFSVQLTLNSWSALKVAYTVRNVQRP